MLERHIRKLGIDYLRSIDTEGMGAIDLKIFLEERFSQPFLMTMLCSILFYHIKKESFWDFIHNNRHELLPDKLSSMIYCDHSVLSYIDNTLPKCTTIRGDAISGLIDLLKGIQSHLIIDDNDYEASGDINEKKGTITEASKDALLSNVEPKYLRLAYILSDRALLAEFYASSLGMPYVDFYYSAIKCGDVPMVSESLRNVSASAVEMLKSEELDVKIIRNMIKKVSLAIGEPRLIKDFDKSDINLDKQDIYITTAYCVDRIINE